jgi:hypothetical protein
VKYILIAIGAQPIDLNIDDSKYVIKSDQFLEYAQYKFPMKLSLLAVGIFHLNLLILLCSGRL